MKATAALLLLSHAFSSHRGVWIPRTPANSEQLVQRRVPGDVVKETLAKSTTLAPQSSD